MQLFRYVRQRGQTLVPGLSLAMTSQQYFRYVDYNLVVVLYLCCSSSARVGLNNLTVSRYELRCIVYAINYTMLTYSVHAGTGIVNCSSFKQSNYCIHATCSPAAVSGNSIMYHILYYIQLLLVNTIIQVPYHYADSVRISPNYRSLCVLVPGTEHSVHFAECRPCPFPSADIVDSVLIYVHYACMLVDPIF